MNKTLVEQKVGADGLTLGLYIEDACLVQKSVYPIAKLLGPVEQALDGMLDKLKAAIPGTWDDAIIEEAKVEYKAKVLSLIAG